MSGLGTLLVSEGMLAVFMAGTWWRVLGQQDSSTGWRRTASLVGLAFPTVALIVQLVLLAVAARYGTLEAMDASTLSGGWSALAGRVWMWSFFLTGLLAFCGLTLGTIGRGNLRIPAAVWSSLMLGCFFVSLILAVNSFH